jgi:DNA ligase-1
MAQPLISLDELVRTSAAVAATSGRLEKIALLAALLKQLAPAEIGIAVGFLTGSPRQSKLGVGWAAASRAGQHPPADTPTLTLHDVDATFEHLAVVNGKRSAAERARLLAELFTRATAREQRFLGALLVGEVRHGALEGVLLEAIATAAALPANTVRRAAMMTGDLGVVAEAALGENGAAALAEYQLQLFRPVQVMLADSADTVEEAMTSGAPVAIEWKIDGARIQVHADGDHVAVYSRNLNDVTDAVPEVVRAVRALHVRDVVLDGEVIALTADGSPRAFQTTMRRFGRRLDVASLETEIPLTPFFFDILRLNGVTLIDDALADRLAQLDAATHGEHAVPRIVTPDAAQAAAFRDAALAKGHEGVMVKTLDSVYAAGRRGSAWIKVKTAKTLDLVVLAVEWGSGRRKGTLSNIHMGARDPGTGTFVMIGKTFKGMTDEMLAWQTKEFLARETHRDGHVVHVRPDMVVEVAFNEVQQSTQYPGGVALRFARVKGYRPDKNAGEADTIDAVQALMSPV